MDLKYVQVLEQVIVKYFKNPVASSLASSADTETETESITTVPFRAGSEEPSDDLTTAQHKIYNKYVKSIIVLVAAVLYAFTSLYLLF